MPVVSMFYGIKVYLYEEVGGKHNKPHIHAYYGEYDLAVDFDGNIIEGSMPRKQKAMVTAWVMMHAEELTANAALLKEGQEIFRIEPLR